MHRGVELTQLLIEPLQTWDQGLGALGGSSDRQRGGSSNVGGLGDYLRVCPRPSLYSTNLNLNAKVLDFVKFGGPTCTVDRTVFELWLGAL